MYFIFLTFLTYASSCKLYEWTWRNNYYLINYPMKQEGKALDDLVYYQYNLLNNILDNKFPIKHDNFSEDSQYIWNKMLERIIRMYDFYDFVETKRLHISEGVYYKNISSEKVYFNVQKYTNFISIINTFFHFKMINDSILINLKEYEEFYNTKNYIYQISFYPRIEISLKDIFTQENLFYDIDEETYNILKHKRIQFERFYYEL